MVTSPLAEDALALEVKVPAEFTSPLKFVVPGGSVVVVGVEVIGVVVVGVVIVLGAVTVTTTVVIGVVVSKAMFTVML